jgi:hypothetical protein
MSVRVALPDGALGEAVRFEAEVLHLILPRAFAPGAPLPLRAVLGDRGAGDPGAGDSGVGEPLELAGKTLGSKRREDGRFDVRARLVSLRRTDRERLASALAPA